MIDPVDHSQWFVCWIHLGVRRSGGICK